jgi:UDP-2,4-diacetamido-2,4,6-trideoxy-beta-L-altropyranose hydrolase
MVISLETKIIFRADASVTLGNGHVMRCLTLASKFKTQGAQCVFICREQAGDAIGLIRNQGFNVHPLPVLNDKPTVHDLDEDIDALDSSVYIKTWIPDLIIVDHYALSSKWETKIKKYCQNIMVIDDLANREHECTLLVDQGLKRKKEDYLHLVGDQCTLLMGQRYSMLREEFSQLRPYSLKRRTTSELHSILVTMGSTDEPNATGIVLEALEPCELPHDCLITIVMGSKAPWLENIKQQAQKLPWRSKVLVDTANMAAIMADSDLAIGAVGGTAWERCCLGLPSLMVILAENQRPGAYALASSGAAKLIGTPDLIKNTLANTLDLLLANPQILSEMSLCARKITNGHGSQKILTEVGKII